MEHTPAYEYLLQLTKHPITLKECCFYDHNSDVWILDEHRHNCIELIYFLYGEAQIITPLEKKSLTLYDVLIYPKNVLHKELIDLHRRQEIINIFLECNTNFDINEAIILKDDTGYIKTIFQAILYHTEQSDYMHEEIIEHLIKLLFLYLVKSAQDSVQLGYGIIEKTIRYVQDNYMKPLSVKELADISHISSSYLSRIMNKQIGMSPMKYVAEIRIEVAKKLLKSSDSIEKIAASVGINDTKYFTKLFKASVGISPSKYRKSIRTSYTQSRPPS